MRPLTNRHLAVLVFVAASLVYAAAIGAPFFWDDRVVLQQQLQFFPTVQSAFSPPKGVPAFTDNYYRPIIIASWKFDDAVTQLLFGSPATAADREASREIVFHTSNVLVHAASAVVVLWLALAWGASRSAATVAATLFALHPLHAEPVVWMSGRSDLWMGLFALLALWFSTRAQPVAVAVCVLLSMLSKETGVAVVVPLVVMALARRRLLPTAIALAAAVVSYLVLRSAALSQVTGSSELASTPLNAVCGAFGWLVAKLALPWPVSPFEQQLPGSVFAVIGVVALTIAVIASTWFKVWRLPIAMPLSVLLAGLAVGVLPALTAVSRTPVAERYTYFATIGIVLMAASAWDRFKATPRARAAVVALVTLVFVVTLIPRIAIWRDPVRLWKLATAQSPTLVLPQLQLGTALEAAGLKADAERAYRDALDRPEPNDRSKAIAASNLGALRAAAGALDEATTLFRKAIVLDERNPQAHLNLARALMDSARLQSNPTPALEEADGHLQRALALYGSWAQAHSLYGQLLLMRGKGSEGIAQIRQALAIDPNLDGADQLRRLIEEESPDR